MSSKPDTITIRSPADFHVHLRQGSTCAAVTRHIRPGGFQVVYVMPNLTPPITTVDQALAYKAELQSIDPHVEFLMTLYLSPSLTVQQVRKAKQRGIVGVKSYPRGVTTNSDSGIEDYGTYYPVFEAMQSEGLVLNLHGELPSNSAADTCVLNAEAKFLPLLVQLHRAFPELRIVLEHATTKEAVEVVKSLGDTVACTITAHHLDLTVDDWSGQPINYCKPVAKFPHDREALREVIREGHPRFFFGSDSAPHPIGQKTTSSHQQACSAGVYTSPILLPILAHLLESFGALDRLEQFASTFGRRFYRLENTKIDHMVTLRRVSWTVQEGYADDENHKFALFWTRKKLGWAIVA